ncbi:MAG: hypothetical protein R2733_06770 [Acidimicrobiales bacterium]
MRQPRPGRPRTEMAAHTTAMRGERQLAGLGLEVLGGVGHYQQQVGHFIGR